MEKNNQKINIDKKASFRYLKDYCFRLIEASICRAPAKANIQLTVFVLSASKKQLHVLYLSRPDEDVQKVHGGFRISN